MEKRNAPALTAAAFPPELHEQNSDLNQNAEDKKHQKSDKDYSSTAKIDSSRKSYSGFTSTIIDINTFNILVNL